MPSGIHAIIASSSMPASVSRRLPPSSITWPSCSPAVSAWRSRAERRGGDASGVMGRYYSVLELPEVVRRAAKVAKTLQSRPTATLYFSDTLLQRLPQDLQHMAVELGEVIEEEHAMVGHDTSPGIGTWPPPISPASEMV